MLSAADLERRLRELHGLALRLQPPLNQRPHIFHEQKYALIEALAQLLVDVGAGGHSFCAGQVDEGRDLLVLRGRKIPVERR